MNSGKKHININFIDFYDSFVPEQSFIYKLLEKHYHIHITDNPDYLFCSVASDDHLTQKDCIKILWTGENQTPDFNLYDYAMGFDYLNYGDRYLRLPFYYLYKLDFELMSCKHQFTEADLKSKKGFCSFVVSNNHASAHRKEFYDLLYDYKPIASGGRYMNNIGKAVDNKLEFTQQYKFAIAFENSSSPGYTTEKLIQAFAAKAIPIYWGDPTITEHFNPKSFINCNDYDSFEEVVAEVRRLDNDDSAYLEVIQTPALKEGEKNVDEMFAEVENFLISIIEQPLNKAQRHDRTYWGRKYNQKLLRRKLCEERSLKGLMEKLYRKIFRSVMNGSNKNVFLWNLHKWLMHKMGR